MELSVKKLLLHNNNWHNYLSYYGSEENGGTVREAIINLMLHVISCKYYLRGHGQFYCSNKNCTHEQRVIFTCENRICNSSGRMATAKWIEKQKITVPPAPWQHIICTMPTALWGFFENQQKVTD